jgi:hypothetical protein
MTLLKEIITEVFGMFVADARLSIGALALVAAAAIAINAIGLHPLLGAGILAVGCPLLLIGNVRRHTRLVRTG